MQNCLVELLLVRRMMSVNATIEQLKELVARQEAEEEAAKETSRKLEETAKLEEPELAE